MPETAIEWATHVWNPFTGCDKCSPGCAYCYAKPAAEGNQRKENGRARKAIAEGKPAPKLRYQKDGDPKTSGPGFGFAVHWDKLEEPERFPTGARVFVNSMSDVFHEEAPYTAISQLFSVAAAQPWANFLILTKRAGRMVDIVGQRRAEGAINGPGRVFRANTLAHARRRGVDTDEVPWPLPNIWLGVTIENRRFVNRAQLLRQVPAAVRFISAEPLLGPLLPDADHMVDGEHETYELGEAPVYAWRPWDDEFAGPGLDLEEIDWLIVGGESGGKHRPIDADWVRALRDYTQEECWQGEREGSTAFFFKQWGGRFPRSGGRELDGRTWDEIPEPEPAVASA